MDTPVYKLYLFKRSLRYYDLSAEAWSQLRVDVTSQQHEMGIRDLFNAEMAWSNEQYEFFGVEFCPSIEAEQEYTRRLQRLEYFQYVEGETFLGLPMDNTYPDFSLEPLAADHKPVYRLHLAGETAYAHLLPAQELEENYRLVADAFKKAGGTPVLSAYTRWNDERYEYFGIERFPDFESLIRYTQFLSSIHWHRIMASRSYLGTAFSGLISGVSGPAA